jgi:hypothetical protein
MAEGGVSLVPFPAGNGAVLFPTDSSVVDFRGSPATANIFTPSDAATVRTVPMGTSAGASPFVAGWVAPVASGTRGQEAVVLVARLPHPPNTAQLAVAEPLGTNAVHVTFDPSSVDLLRGQTQVITATITPANAASQVSFSVQDSRATLTTSAVASATIAALGSAINISEGNSASVQLKLTDTTSVAAPGSGPDIAEIHAKLPDSVIGSLPINFKKEASELWNDFKATIRDKKDEGLETFMKTMPDDCAKRIAQQAVVQISRLGSIQDQNGAELALRALMLPTCQKGASFVITTAEGTPPVYTTVSETSPVYTIGTTTTPVTSAGTAAMPIYSTGTASSPIARSTQLERIQTHVEVHVDYSDPIADLKHLGSSVTWNRVANATHINPTVKVMFPLKQTLSHELPDGFTRDAREGIFVEINVQDEFTARELTEKGLSGLIGGTWRAEVTFGIRTNFSWNSPKH